MVLYTCCLTARAPIGGVGARRGLDAGVAGHRVPWALGHRRIAGLTIGGERCGVTPVKRRATPTVSV